MNYETRVTVSDKDGKEIPFDRWAFKEIQDLNRRLAVLEKERTKRIGG